VNSCPLKLALACALAISLSSARAAQANSITLDGLLGSGVTATISNYSLVGDVFSGTITNTSPVGGLLTNFDLVLGDTLALASFTTTAPFTYSAIDDSGLSPSPETPGIIPDFALFPPGLSQAIGSSVGQSFSFAWTLTLDNGGALTGVTADELAENMAVRFRMVPTSPTGSDLALVTPEPSSLILFGTGIFGFLARRRRAP
jgi:hypothetical protein